MPDPQKPGSVIGYTEQTQECIDLVNKFKTVEGELGELIAGLAGRDDIDPRMLELARTRLQEGFMWASRSVFQPVSKL